MSDDELDLGSGHRLRFFRLPHVERAWFSVYHQRGDGMVCVAAGHFDLPEMQRWFAPETKWQVVSWEPLTLSPSIRCRECGDHGFIRDGRWVSA